MKLLKFLCALALLPTLSASLLWLWWLAGTCWNRSGNIPEPLLWFTPGFVIALFCYIALPRPAWLYVLGHESTHALAVWLSGGKVESFRVSGESGHVVSTKNSAWISLSPYVLPFYPVLALLIWTTLAWLLPEALRYQGVFLMLWGLLWGYHMAFTASLMKTKQPDFVSQGFLFSWVIILLANTWIIALLLLLGLAVVSWTDAFSQLAHFVKSHYILIYDGLRWLLNVLN